MIQLRQLRRLVLMVVQQAVVRVLLLLVVVLIIVWRGRGDRHHRIVGTGRSSRPGGLLKQRLSDGRRHGRVGLLLIPVAVVVVVVGFPPPIAGVRHWFDGSLVARVMRRGRRAAVQHRFAGNRSAGADRSAGGDAATLRLGNPPPLGLLDQPVVPRPGGKLEFPRRRTSGLFPGRLPRGLVASVLLLLLRFQRKLSPWRRASPG